MALKKILYLLLLMSLLAPSAAFSMECTAKEGWPFFPSESDMNTFVSIVQAKDTVAAEAMAKAGKVYYFKENAKVYRESGFATCKFRVPGTTVFAFTYCEALTSCK